MIHIAELHVEDDGHEGLDMPEFDKVKIEFTPENIAALNEAHKLMQEYPHLASVQTGWEPTVSAMLDGEVVDHSGSHFEEALHYCMVTIDGTGEVCISFECKHSGARSFVNSFNLTQDVDAIANGVCHD